MKILWLAAVALTAVILAGILAIQTPGVQTYLSRQAIEKISSAADAEIKFDKIHIKPFNALVIKNIAIIDRNPCDSTAADTLFAAEYVIARFTLKGLGRQEGLHIGRTYLRNAEMSLVIEEDGTNLQRMLGIDKNREKKPQDRNIFDIRRVDINGMEFRMQNFRKEDKARHEGTIDWNDLEVTGINLGARNLKLSGGIMSGRVDYMSFREKSGYACNSISGKARVGNGLTIVEDLEINDLWSDVRLSSFVMSYGSSADFKDFVGKVRLDASISGGRLGMQSLAFFVPGLSGNMFSADIRGNISGTVSSLSLADLTVDGGKDKISGTFSGMVTGLPETDKMYLDLKMDGLGFSTDGLHDFIRNWGHGNAPDIRRYAKGETFTLDGRARGTLGRLKISAGINSGIGSIYADINMTGLTSRTQSIRIGGNLKTEDFDIGKAMGYNAIRQCTMNARLHADLGNRDGSPELAIDSLFISRLNINDYDYSKIAAAGTVAKETFNGKIICSDPNLNFMFQGMFNLSRKTSNALYKFYMHVGYADLHAMNIDRRGISRVSFRTTANFNLLKKSGALIGDIDIAELVLENSMGKYDIGKISINSYSGNDINRMSFLSEFAEGNFTGTAPVTKFIRDFKSVTLKKELPAMFRDTSMTWDNERYRLSVKTFNSMDLMSFLAPGVYIDDSTSLTARIDSSGTFSARLQSPRLAFKEHYVKDLTLEMDNAGENLSGKVNSGSIKLATLSLNNSLMEFFADDNHVGLGFSYDNRSTLTNRGEFFALADVSRDAGEEMGIEVNILPTSIYLNDREWNIRPSKFSVKGRDIDVDILEFTSGDQTVRVSGKTSEKTGSRLTVALDRFDISVVNPLMKKDMAFSGAVTGTADILTPYSSLGLDMNFLCDSMTAAGSGLGTVMLSGRLDGTGGGKRLDLNLSNDISGKRTFSIGGNYAIRSRKADFGITLDRFDISCMKPLLSDVISDMDGHISGRFSARGPVDRLAVRSENAGFENAGLTVGFTNVMYLLNGGFRLDETGVYFDNVNIEDGKDGRGMLSGSISYDHFKDIRFNARANVINIAAIDLAENESEQFYGNVSATGSVEFSGPMKSLLLTVNAATSGDGQFHIPLSSGGNATGSNLLTYKEPVVIKKIDPYETMIARMKEQETKESDFRMKLRVAVTQGTEAFIEIDKATGNLLSGRGDGVIEIELQPKKDIFNITGDYTIASGNYRFVALGFASRDFTIQDGSSVKFNGDIMESMLDIDALYTTKASLSTLIADTTSVSNRRTVECGISITDKLSNPRLGFSIAVPDLDPTVQSRVESALSTEDKVQKQFLSLIISNSFLPDEQSGIVNNSSMLYSNVTDIMTNQLNNIFQKLNIPLDLGLNYQPNEKGNDIFDVAVSTQLFNNRVIVNGNIGNRQYNSGSSGSDVVGDLDIEIKLTRSGALRLTLFSHSADEYTNYLDNSQRNGIGIAWQKEFDRFDTFVRNIFKKREEREEEERRALVERRNMERNVIIIGPDDRKADKRERQKATRRKEKKTGYD